MKQFFFPVFVLSAIILCSFIKADRPAAADVFEGAWYRSGGGFEEVFIFEDGYCSRTRFSKQNKRFDFTTGGPYRVGRDSLIISSEFHSSDTLQAGSPTSSRWRMEGKALVFQELHQAKVGAQPDSVTRWSRIDRSDNPLAGCWRINGRMQDGKMSAIHAGARKTIKILSGTRFQWIAINTATREFFGTGGGTYEFDKGKYTETIEFFSRDSSRVGASLVFDAKIDQGVWFHSGKSSRGDPVHETWIKHELR